MDKARQVLCDERPNAFVNGRVFAQSKVVAVRAVQLPFVATHFLPNWATTKLRCMTQDAAKPPQANDPSKPYNGVNGVPFKTVLRHWWSIDSERPGAVWQYYLATGLYNTAIAVLLTLLFFMSDSRKGFDQIFSETWVISQCIGYCINIGFDGFFSLTRPAWRQSLSKPMFRSIMMTIPIFAVYLGYTLAFALNGKNFLAIITRYPRAGFMLLSIGLIVSFIWFLVMDGQTKQLRAQAEQARADEAAAALQKQASEAELRALQAQIEPHFLFNTLANVQALIDYEPGKAKHMLETFIEYLRATLDASRRTQATLGEELTMLERYLQLMQVRMGDRLHFEFDVSADLRAHPFAPLLLQPLVENAIKYGLEPQIEGGTVRIAASQSNGRIRIDVIDDGAGLNTSTTAKRPAAKSGNGTGMKNVLARLQSNFGSNATLSIANNDRGCLTTVEFDSKTLQNKQP